MAALEGSVRTAHAEFMVAAILRQAEADARLYCALLASAEREQTDAADGRQMSPSDPLVRAQEAYRIDLAEPASVREPWRTALPGLKQIRDRLEHMATQTKNPGRRRLYRSLFFLWFCAWMLHGAIHAQAHLGVDVLVRRGGQWSEEQLDRIAELLWRLHGARALAPVD